VRFGTDPRCSALDLNCKAHDLDNLYVVDASFFPSSSAVNPGLTTIANALRVGDHLSERLGVPRVAGSRVNGNVRTDAQTIQPRSTEP
jgi:choline dehydrogenase-like flavoprotein